MRTLNWYLDKAREKQGFKSDRQLALALSGVHSLVTSYRRMKAYPSPEMMVKLANYADVPVEIALADLGYWTNFDTEAAPAYKKMAEIVAKAKNYAAAVIIGTGVVTSGFTGSFSESASADDTLLSRHDDAQKIYIMGNICDLYVLSLKNCFVLM